MLCELYLALSAWNTCGTRDERQWLEQNSRMSLKTQFLRGRMVAPYPCPVHMSFCRHASFRHSQRHRRWHGMNPPGAALSAHVTEHNTVKGFHEVHGISRVSFQTGCLTPRNRHSRLIGYCPRVPWQAKQDGNAVPGLHRSSVAHSTNVCPRLRAN